MIKAVIFDMDGLLIDSEPLWGKTTTKIYGSVGINLSEEDHNLLRGRDVLQNTEYFYATRPWQGGPTPAELAEAIIDEMAELVKTDSKLMPGVDKVIKICKKHDLPVAIASSSPMKLIDSVVDALKIREHFKHIYSAQFEEFSKPHPAVFISVAKHLGMQPHECLVLEDSPFGVLAAKSAGMQCVAVPIKQNKNNKFIQTADIILDSLEDFKEAMLESL